MKVKTFTDGRVAEQAEPKGITPNPHGALVRSHARSLGIEVTVTSSADPGSAASSSSSRLRLLPPRSPVPRSEHDSAVAQVAEVGDMDQSAVALVVVVRDRPVNACRRKGSERARLRPGRGARLSRGSGPGRMPGHSYSRACSW